MNRQEWQYKNRKKNQWSTITGIIADNIYVCMLGQKVYVQHEKTRLWEPGMIRHHDTNPGSYIVESESSIIHRRNIQFIRPAKRDSILKDRYDQPPVTDANASQKEPQTSVSIPLLHHTRQSGSSTYPSQIMIPEEQTPPVLKKQPTTESLIIRHYRPIPKPRRSMCCIKTPQRLDL